MVTFAETYFYSIYQMLCWTVLVFLSSTLPITLYFYSVRIDFSIPRLLLYVLIQSLRPSMMLALAFSHEILLFLLHLGPLVNNVFNLLYFYGMQISSNYML